MKKRGEYENTDCIEYDRGLFHLWSGSSGFKEWFFGP